MIRAADFADIPGLLELGIRFMRESRYRAAQPDSQSGRSVLDASTP